MQKLQKINMCEEQKEHGPSKLIYGENSRSTLAHPSPPVPGSDAPLYLVPGSLVGKSQAQDMTAEVTKMGVYETAHCIHEHFAEVGLPTWSYATAVFVSFRLEHRVRNSSALR